MKQHATRRSKLPYVGLLILTLTLAVQLGYMITTTRSLAVASRDASPEEAPIMVKPSRAFASDIIQRSFRETYSHLQDCPREEKFAICMSMVSDNFNSTVPWWFKTLLRDGSNAIRPHQLEGGWHYLASNNPSVRMCTIEKIGTTQWRKVFSSLNGAQGRNFAFRPNETVPDEAPSFVFFRDPLERFLSAYIDKCVTKSRRVSEKHCYPNLIFNNPENSLIRGLEDDKRLLFAAYVDTMPLDWNLHFFPQSFYCNGIFRHLDTYDYVGNMGPNFYHKLHRIGQRYGGRFERAVADVFDLRNKLNSSEVNMGVETSAPLHVKDYYTAQTVQRVLQYLAIDYVLLRLPVPRWAEDMLAGSK